MVKLCQFKEEKYLGDFSGGPVVETSPSNAEDLIPGQGAKIPHVW